MSMKIFRMKTKLYIKEKNMKMNEIKNENFF